MGKDICVLRYRQRGLVKEKIDLCVLPLPVLPQLLDADPWHVPKERSVN
jgi:hypothetical protein